MTAVGPQDTLPSRSPKISDETSQMPCSLHRSERTALCMCRYRSALSRGIMLFDKQTISAPPCLAMAEAISGKFVS